MTSLRTRLRRLLDHGFYPLELPPPFATRHFSAVADTLVPPNTYAGSTTFFDGATFRGPLRTFGVINPINYLLLSKFIASGWKDISAVYKLSSSSGARPKFPQLSAEGRAIALGSLAKKRQSQRHLASLYPIITSLDINRFYGSIYTHSIPWAVLGKQEAKRRHHSRTLTGHWSDTLDRLVRNCNQQQTVGIPIGPDTSRIISELVLSRVDADLASAGSGISSQQIYHNIDDYQIGALSIGEAENAQSRFVRAISRYELRLNDFKTSVEQGLNFVPSIFQRHFDILRGQTGRDFVEHFFEIVYAQAQQNPNTNVIGYALKRFSKNLARNREQVLVQEYLQRLVFAAPHQVRWTLPLLLGIYRETGVGADTRRLVIWGIETSARRNDVGSLLWFLYAAIFLRIRLNSAVCSHCFGMSSELADLMLVHGRFLGLFSVEVGELQRRYKGNDFKSPGWLPLYEIGRRGWDNSAAFAKLGTGDDHDSLYESLRASDVEFYLTNQEQFEVTAFGGWGLTQQDFSQEVRDQELDADAYLAFYAAGDVETYD